MRLDKLEIRWLKLFCIIVEKRGITNAQDATGLTQPVLSNYLSRLEDVLGVLLCERGRSGFKLTSEGEIVYQEAKSIITTINEFAHRLARIQHQLKGTVKLGCLDNTATHPNNVVSHAIAKLYQQSSEVNVKLGITEYTPLIEHLKNANLDIVLSALPDDFPVDIYYEPVFIEHSYLYSTAKEAKYIERDWRNGSLNQRRLLIGGHAVNEISKQLGPVSKQAFHQTAWHLESSLLLLLAGTHISYLPDHYAAPWVEKGKLAAIAPDELNLTSIFYLIRNARQPGSRSVMEQYRGGRKRFISQPKVTFMPPTV